MSDRTRKLSENTKNPQQRLANQLPKKSKKKTSSVMEPISKKRKLPNSKIPTKKTKEGESVNSKK